MRIRLRRLRAVTLLLCIVSQLTACSGTQPARFYTLSSLAGSGDAERSPVGQPREIIGIGPVAMAKYLDHPGITTRSGENTITRSELDRWGGSLGDEVNRVLVENMGQLLPGGRYLVLPWLETSVIDCRVQLNITRFEKTPEGPVMLSAAWMLLGRERNTLLASGDAVITEPVHGTGYAAISGAMSRGLAELSRRIAAEIRKMSGGGEFVLPEPPGAYR
ncbi:MAG: PqiC family protein [Desulfuromonadaceae bacterium]|nr:PqiC family protein [Desulfuromonadaceae bacterium]MDD2849282.1 PqiC family protein [Desulfuromonadaceae bacterium]MDD4131909.1 PqiC family protein [Desulfuromonadaceae bacterium]